MDILMYGWEFPPNISGGLGVACYGIVRALIERQVNVFFVLPYSTENPFHDPRISFLDCHFFQPDDPVRSEQWKRQFHFDSIDAFLSPYLSEEMYRKHLGEWFGSALHPAKHAQAIEAGFSGKYGKNLISEVWRYAKLAGLLAKTTPHDVIHAHDWMSILAGVEAKKYSRKPLIFHIHSLEVDRSGDSVNPLIFDIERQGIEQADKIITVSHYTKDMAIRRYGAPESKVTVAYNGLDPSDRSESSSRVKQMKMVLFVGRITQQKGPRFFIEVAKKVLSRSPDVQFVMAGQGNLWAEAIRQVAGLRIGVNVHFTGFLKPDQVAKLYEQASVYVMPSVSEPFGLSSLEALSHQVPIVISKQSGAAEVLPNVFKADFWDTDEMASKILALLDYEPLGRTMLRHSGHDLSKLTWSDTASTLVEVYGSMKN